MIALHWVEIASHHVPPGARGYHASVTGDVHGLLVFVGREPQGWHLSISHPMRYPTWDEIVDARYALVPNDVTMAMLLPPKEQYVNLHENCFHLHEVPGDEPSTTRITFDR